MNAHNFPHPPISPAAAIERFDRRSFEINPDRRACFDCVAMVNLLTGSDIDPQWMEHGGDLPFQKIALDDARPGDLITFYMPKWPNMRHHVALMSDGSSINDARAKVFGPFYAHAATAGWMRAWLQFAVAAYRINTATKGAA